MRPPRDRSLFRQEDSFDLNISTSGSHVLTRRRLAPTGMPRYLKGITPTLHPKKCVVLWRKPSLLLTAMILLFEKLILRPKATSNSLRIDLIAQTLLAVGLVMKILSSANWRWVIDTLSLSISYPSRTPLLFALDFIPFKPSATIRKSNGERGSPWWRPRPNLNS